MKGLRYVVRPENRNYERVTCVGDVYDVVTFGAMDYCPDGQPYTVLCDMRDASDYDHIVAWHSRRADLDSAHEQVVHDVQAGTITHCLQKR